MDDSAFDALVRHLRIGLSRRTLLRRAAVPTVTGPVTFLGGRAARAQGKDKDKDKDKGNKTVKGNQGQGNQGQAVGAGDRDIGHPCAGNQRCREGLYCWPTGPGSVPRCTDQPPPDAAVNQTVVQTNNQVCAGDCEQESAQTVIAGNAQGFGALATYWIEVDCQFDAGRYETRCLCTPRGAAGAPPVRKITLPSADVCAVVVTADMQPAGVLPSTESPEATGGEASAGTGGVANADASGGAVSIGDVRGDNEIAIDASGGTANADASGGDNNVAIAGGGQGDGAAAQAVEFGALELRLEGNVVPGKTTTYWVDTDQGRRPAPGPALVQVAEESAESGTIIAEARACTTTAAEPDFDWFGQCTAPVTGMAFNLFPEGGGDAPLATLEVNAQGRARFGNLPPGIYQVQPQGQVWCYAESDQVDANGNVLVEAGLESHVWSFVCGSGAGS